MLHPTQDRARCEGDTVFGRRDQVSGRESIRGYLFERPDLGAAVPLPN